MKAATAKPELMAPAGGPDAGYAALQYGADAIYLGLPRFSARADADNFGPDDLDAIVAFAHAQTPRRRVYAAVNTLVLQEELPLLADQLGLLADLGVDAAIVQDLGVASLVRRHAPTLRLHASTQLAIHNREGVEALRRFGFARATLARELTLEEIRDIARTPGIETEAFVHGALCYCYSGLCLYSSMETGRSGNRGRCAYLCRGRFSGDAVPPPAGGGPGAADGRFVFSMKDLALPDAVGALREAGVASLKIEGRKKNALYVAAVTSFYRRLLDGALPDADRRAAESDIRSVFSRPWTPLFTDSRRRPGVVDPDTVGHRGAPAGRLERIVAGPGRPQRLRFRTAVPLECHDGLQIDIPGADRPFGFAVDRLFAADAERSALRPAFTAPAGAWVEVELPAVHPPLPAGATVYRSSSQDVKKRYRHERPRPGDFRIRYPVRVRLALRPGLLEARAALAPVLPGEPEREAKWRDAADLAPARDPAALESTARGAFEKLGDTRWRLDALELDNPAGLFVPVSRLNQVRRSLCGELDAMWTDRLARRQRAILADLPGPAAFGATVFNAASAAAWSVKTDRPESLLGFDARDWEGVDEAILEIEATPSAAWRDGLARLADAIGRARIRLALPIVARGWETARLKETVAGLWADGWRRWQASNLSAWTFLPSDGLDLTADWPLYAMNAAAVRAWTETGARSVTFSPEDGLPNLRRLLPLCGGTGAVIVFQDTPLFISEACVRVAAGGRCPGPAACDFKEDRLVAEDGRETIAVNRRCRSFLIGKAPLCWSHLRPEMEAAGANRFRADFILRSRTADETAALWRMIRTGQPIPGTRIANADRGLE